MKQKKDVVILKASDFRHEKISSFFTARGGSASNNPVIKRRADAEHDELYQDVHRSIQINNIKLNEIYEKTYQDEWKNGYRIDQNNKVKDLIKNLLHVDDKAINKLENEYIQDVTSLAPTPFLCPHFLMPKHEPVTNLYKTHTGDIGLCTELELTSLEKIYFLEHDTYKFKCKIKVYWEPAKDGGYEFRGMEISGRDRELAALMFTNNYVKEVKYDYGEEEIAREGYYPEFFQNRFTLPLGDSQEFIEALSQEEHSDVTLLSAARENSKIYKEIVEPKINFNYIFRKINEYFENIKLRPEFTIQQHAEIILLHSQKFLNDNRKNNPYRKILNQLTPTEKLDFLYKYSTLPGHNLSHLGRDFFKDIEENLLAALTDEKEKIAIYKNLDKLVTYGAINTVKNLRTRWEKLFSYYENNRPAKNTNSLASIEERLAMLEHANNLKESIDRFGSKFLIDLYSQLCNLAKYGSHNSAFSSQEKQSISNIFGIISGHDSLYDLFADRSEFADYLAPLVNIKEDLNANRRGNQIDGELKDAGIEAQRTTENAGSQVKSAETEINVAQQQKDNSGAKTLSPSSPLRPK